MTRYLGLALLLAAAAAGQTPNFIVILADDLGYGDLSVYGSKTIRTPRLDQMAAQGVRLTSFYAGAPFCSPSRAALLTGRYPVRAGVPNVLFPTETTGLPPAEITLAEMLKPAGYVTGAIGKWHLGWPKELRAQRQGFDFFYGLPYSNDMYQVGPDEELRAQHARWDLPLLEDDEILEAPVEQHTLTERYTERARSGSFVPIGNGHSSCTFRTRSRIARCMRPRIGRAARRMDSTRMSSRNWTTARAAFSIC